jgi:uroporphyrinogen-III synthase
MVKNGQKKSTSGKIIKNILITQPRPDSEKSPYFELAKKFDVQLDFHPFIRVEGVISRDFAVIFTSRHSIDHFFRICEEMKVNVSQDTKYFCIAEAVALYLQKFILYRKRKVFYGADGTNKSLFDVINKHKDNEKFLYPCSETQDNEITTWLKNNRCEYATPVLYRTVSNNVKELLGGNEYDIICFFTPSGVKSLFENMPDFRQNGTKIGAFGSNTSKAVEDAGLHLDIKAPEPEAPSMVAALERYLKLAKD